VAGELQRKVNDEMQRRGLRAPQVVGPSGMSAEALNRWLRMEGPPGPRLQRAIAHGLGWVTDWPTADQVTPPGELDRDQIAERLDALLSAVEHLTELAERAERRAGR
jgi:hypothetical protein